MGAGGQVMQLITRVLVVNSGFGEEAVPGVLRQRNRRAHIR